MIWFDLRSLDFALVEVEFVLHLLAQAIFLLLRVRLQLHHLVDLLQDLPVQVLKLVCFVSELVDVVEEGVVLLFSLDKRRDDFVDCRDSRRLLDLLESVLDHFDVAQVLVHQSLLLPVSSDDFGQAQLQDGKWVLELTVLRLFFGGSSRLVIFNLVLLLLLVEFLLVAFDLGLEVVLVFLVLGTKGDCLIDLLLCQALAEQGLVIFLLSLDMHRLGEVLKSLGLVVLVHDLAAEHVDLPLGILVLGDGLVQAELLLLYRVLLAIQPDVVSLVSDRGRLYLADVGSLLLHLVIDLLDLVLEDLQLTLLVLELVRVDVHFTLQSGCFALVDWVFTATHGSTTCNRCHF